METYSLSQTSLEQVFLSFAKKQQQQAKYDHRKEFGVGAEEEREEEEGSGEDFTSSRVVLELDPERNERDKRDEEESYTMVVKEQEEEEGPEVVIFNRSTLEQHQHQRVNLAFEASL